MRHSKSIRFQLLLSSVLFSAAGCSESKLALMETASNYVAKTTVDVCTTPADQLKSHVKFIFVVDRSRSNIQNYLITPQGRPGTQISATDPDGTRRYQAITDFVTNYAGDRANTFWSILRFSDRAETISNPDFMLDQTRRTDFVNLVRNPAGQLWRYNATTALGNPDDNGATNYSESLIRLKEMITDDVEAEKQKRASDPAYAIQGVTIQYVVFFISDGAPWIVAPSGLSMVRISNNEIQGHVNGLMSLQNTERQIIEGIQLNTGFYKGNNSGAPAAVQAQIQTTEQDAENLLSNMAIWGQGRALSFSAGQSIDFNAFGIPVRIPRFALKELWVQNASAVWLGNKMVADTDNDMVADTEEIRLGSDPTSADSDRNGLSDGVEYLVSGRTQTCAANHKTNGLCRPTNPERNWYYCGTPPQAPVSGGPIYADSDGDFLNDCEERNILRSLSDDADSNQDYIPDSLALSNEIDLLPGTLPKDLDPDFDGMTNYFELRRMAPPHFDNLRVPGLRLAQYTVRQTPDAGASNCFSYDIENMPLITNTDLIRVFVMESTTIISQKRKIRTAQKRSISGFAGFSRSDF